MYWFTTVVPPRKPNLWSRVSTPKEAARSTRPETKPRLSLGVLIDTSAHQKKVIEFQRDVVNSVAEDFAGLAAESLSPENWPDEKFSQKRRRRRKTAFRSGVHQLRRRFFRTVRFPTCKMPHVRSCQSL